GRILAVSNETGHYRLPDNLFYKFLAELTIIPGNAVVRVFASDGSKRYATCDEIRSSGSGDEEIWLDKNRGKDSSGYYRPKKQLWATSKLPQIEWGEPEAEYA